MLAARNNWCDPVSAGFAIVLVLVAAQFAVHVRAQTVTMDRDIVLLQRILKQRPDADLYYRLGDLYVQKGRQTGDITYFNLAATSLREALELQPNLEPAHRHLAFVLYSLHDFAGAASQAHQAIDLDPGDSYAYGVLGDTQLETGEHVWATLYLTIFCVGTIIGMGLITTAIATPFIVASRRMSWLHKAFVTGAGLLSFGFGLFLAYQIGIIDGLFSTVPIWTPH